MLSSDLFGCYWVIFLDEKTQFALGSSYQAIREHIRDMFGTEISNGTINAITDKLIPELRA